MYPLLWGFPEPQGRGGKAEGAPNPQGQVHICAHAYTLFWQHPPRGEASTCPIPEQGAGVVARPQLGWPDSGQRNEGGGHSSPGGLAQELEPSGPRARGPGLGPGPDPALPPPQWMAGQPGSQDSECSEILSLKLSVLVNKLGPSNRSRPRTHGDFIHLETRQRDMNITKTFR